MTNKTLILAVSLALSSCASQPQPAQKPGSLLDNTDIKNSASKVTVGVDLSPSPYPKPRYSLGTDGLYHFNSVYNKN